MSAKETKIRVANAFRAMKAIGISEDKVKPVLKSLVKLYDKNWEYIEQENYRVLADAIFESEESKTRESVEKVVNDEVTEQQNKIVNDENNKEKEAESTQEPERPSKRLRRGSTSTLNTTSKDVPEHSSLIKPKEEPNELPNIDLPSNGVNKSQPGSRLRTESASPSHSMKLRDRGMGSASSQVAPGETRSCPESSSQAAQIKEPKVKADVPLPAKRKSNNTACALLTPKDEPITDEMPCLEVPSRVNHPEPTKDGDPSSGNCSRRKTCSPQPLQSRNGNEKDFAAASTSEVKENGEIAKDSGHCSSNLEIASSLSGEMRISFIHDLAIGKPCTHIPSVEAVIKSVENKYIISPMSSGAKVPLMDLMKELCESYLKPGTDPSDETPLPKRLSHPSHCNGINDGLPPNEAGDTNGISPDRENPEKHMREKTEMSKEDTQNWSLIAGETSTSLNFAVDVAKGQEKVAISLVNEVNDEPPPSFHYIPQNLVFQNAYVNFSLARIGDNNCCSSCEGDCLSSPIPCACSHETGGDFAYTIGGLVKEELLKECISMNHDPKRHCQFFCKECPLERIKNEDSIEACKGHLVRKFIKECWSKCGCNKQCGNRVVQRGITRNLQVFMAPGGKGWGLRTLEDLPKGAFVCEYVGEVLTNAELFERVQHTPESERHSYPVLLDADWCAEGVLKDEEALCLDATHYGNVARFINHRCYDSNLVEIPVEVETPDHHYYHLAFFTTRKVKAMEELTWDYGIDFDDHEHPIKAFRCQCGSKFCRNIKRTRTRARR